MRGSELLFRLQEESVLQTTMITILLSRLQLSFPSKGERKTKVDFPIFFLEKRTEN